MRSTLLFPQNHITFKLTMAKILTRMSFLIPLTLFILVTAAVTEDDTVQVLNEIDTSATSTGGQTSSAQTARDGVVKEITGFLSRHCADTSRLTEEIKSKLDSFVKTHIKSKPRDSCDNRTTGCKHQWTIQFPDKKHLNYAEYLGTIPTLQAFTMCAWIFHDSDNAFVTGTIVSYCNNASTRCNHLYIRIGKKGDKLHIRINNKDDIKVKIDRILAYPTHMCVVMSVERGSLQIYINGTIVESSLPLNYLSPIVGNGVIILGQDQDRDNELPGKPKSENQSFSGQIENFYLWDRPLSTSEITSVYDYHCYPITGKIVSLNDSNVRIVGDVSYNYTSTDNCLT